MKEYKLLGTPLSIGKVTVRNRFAVAPMGGSTHYRHEGGFNNDSIEYFAARARGGFGLIYTGAITTDYEVDKMSGIGPSPLLTPDSFKRWGMELNERVGAYGSKMFAQVTMGLGRNYPGLYAPSAVQVFGHPELKAPEMTTEQVKIKIDAVVRGAKLMQESGFAGVEVHSIHWGYLLDQFALSMMNHRTDEYGGSLENRLRAAKEIVEGIKQVCGEDYPVGMRLGLKTYITDFGRGSLNGENEMGRTLEEGVEIARLLESYGYDVLSVDTGTYDSFYYACPPMYMPKGFMTELAAKAKEAVHIPVLAGGRMNDPDIAEKALQDGKIDGVVLGRASLADPEYPNKVLSGRAEEIRPCIACNMGCITRLQRGLQTSCAVNPTAMREVRYALKPSATVKNIVVVGGGVAGMEVARTAARRGHKVTLLEKNAELGGNLIPGGSHSFKKEVRDLRDWYERQLKNLNVEVRTNCGAETEQLRKMGADVIVLATGATPIVPRIEGIDDPKVMTCIEALAHPEKVGQKVIIVGGGLVGSEIALDYLKDGREVTIIEAKENILSAGEPIPIMNRQMLTEMFEEYHANIMTGAMLKAIKNGRALVEIDGKQHAFDADTIIMSIGFRPRPSMAGELVNCGAAVYEIGDGRQVATIMKAIWAGYELGNNL